jgi:hypothetical protein
MGGRKKATIRTSRCNIHNACNNASNRRAETLGSARMGASKSMSKDKSMDASNSRRADNRRNLH